MKDRPRMLISHDELEAFLQHKPYITYIVAYGNHSNIWFLYTWSTKSVTPVKYERYTTKDEAQRAMYKLMGVEPPEEVKRVDLAEAAHAIFSA